MNRSKPELCFISVYYPSKEKAERASRKLSRLLNVTMYVYEEKHLGEVMYYITSNVKCGNDYVNTIGIRQRL
jgi:hypothetical protein